jgi:hypothetical protein
VKPLAVGVGDVPYSDAELGRATLRSVVMERQIADDSVPLSIEPDGQLLGDVERSVGVDCEQRIEVADAERATLRANVIAERESECANEEERAATRKREAGRGKGDGGWGMGEAGNGKLLTGNGPVVKS